MKRTAALLLALSLTVPVAACSGTDEGGQGEPAPASESASASEPTSAPPDGGLIGVGDVRIIHQTNAGGRTTDQAMVLRSQADVNAFVSGFDGGRLAHGVQKAYDEQSLNAGTVLLASVVAIGCDVPRDATVTRKGETVVITPQKLPTGTKQCFAPVTSVALVEVDKSTLPR